MLVHLILYHVHVHQQPNLLILNMDIFTNFHTIKKKRQCLTMTIKKSMIPELWSLKIRKEIQHRTVNIDIHKNIHKNNKYIYFSLQCLSPTLDPIMPQPLAAVTTRAMAMPPGTAPSATLLPNSPWVDARAAGPHTTNTATSSVETGSLGGRQRY